MIVPVESKRQPAGNKQTFYSSPAAFGIHLPKNRYLRQISVVFFNLGRVVSLLQLGLGLFVAGHLLALLLDLALAGFFLPG
jgi:hypothetical protein